LPSGPGTRIIPGVVGAERFWALLELDASDDVPSGRLIGIDGSEHRFSGALGLLSVIHRLPQGSDESTPDSGEEKGGDGR
jgi:hypothetical protein